MYKVIYTNVNEGINREVICEVETITEAREEIAHQQGMDSDPADEYEIVGEDWEEITIVLDTTGNEVDFDAAVNCMDDELREELHSELAPCKPQAFFNAYAKAHEERFGEEWAPYAGLAW